MNFPFMCTFRHQTIGRFLNMNLTDYYWSFVCENGDEYLDCQLLTASGVYLTNRCFLRLSGLIEETVDNKDLIILMPDFSQSDVNQKLNGYIKPKKPFIQDMKNASVKESCDLSNLLDKHSSNQNTEIHQPYAKKKEEFI